MATADRAIRLVLIGLLGLVTGCAAHRPASVDAWRQRLTMTTTADGQRLAYLDVGPRDAEVVLLLHGLPTSSYLYHQVADDLTAAGYRVVAPDLVGFGASAKPTDHDAYRFDRQADRVRGLLDQLDIAAVTLVVHDLGGLVGWELLDHAPERVARLLVLNTTAYAGFRPPVQMRMMAGVLGPSMASMMAGGTMGRSLTATFVEDNTGVPDRVSAATVDAFWWALHEGATRPMRHMAQTFGALRAALPRYQEALRRFPGPAMVVWGGKDAVLRAEQIVPRFAADLRLPPSAVRVVADAGHFVIIDAPAVVSGAVVELMRQSTTRPELPMPDRAATAATDRAVEAPAPGPTVRAALELSDRFDTEGDDHDVRVGLRVRALIGDRWGYAVGLDGDAGWAGGFGYRVAGHPLGLGWAARGRQLTLVAGIGVRGGPDTGAQLELPVAIDASLPAGPVSALAWSRLAWLRGAPAEVAWQVGLGLRLGRTRAYFPGAYLGAGPYLAAVVDGVGARRQLGVVLGVELSDGH